MSKLLKYDQARLASLRSLASVAAISAVPFTCCAFAETGKPLLVKSIRSLSKPHHTACLHR